MSASCSSTEAVHLLDALKTQKPNEKSNERPKTKPKQQHFQIRFELLCGGGSYPFQCSNSDLVKGLLRECIDEVLPSKKEVAYSANFLDALYTLDLPENKGKTILRYEIEQTDGKNDKIILAKQYLFNVPNSPDINLGVTVRTAIGIAINILSQI